MKVIKVFINIFVLCSVLFLLISLNSIIKLVFTDDKISKVPLTKYYLAKVQSGEQDFEVFSHYMQSKGWNRTDQIGGISTFEKDGTQLEIVNTHVKTLIIDGNLNFQSMNPKL